MQVSVIIPVYNAECFLENAVNSALQLEEVEEILLCEDNSLDNSLEICKELVKKDNRIKLLQHPDKGNHGAGATRNLGIENATQDFIAFLDADDYYLANRFNTDKILFQNANIEGVFNAIGTDFITEKGKEEFRKKFAQSSLTTVKKHAEGKAVFYGLLGLHNDFGTFFHLNGLTIRRPALLKAGIKFNPELKVHQDSDFIIKLSYHGYLKSGNITEAVAMRGVHDDNRITKIRQYSAEYNKRQAMLWESIYEWSRGMEIEKTYKSHINRQFSAFRLTQENRINKTILFFKYFMKDPQIVRTRYRFTYFKL